MPLKQENQRNNLNKIFFLLIHSIQILLIFALSILSYLSDKKAGVNHHMIYMSYKYKEGIYSPLSLKIQSIIIVLIVILLLQSLLKSRRRLIKEAFSFNNMMAIIIGVFLLLIINFSFFKSMIAYVYFVMVFEIVFALQILIILINKMLGNS
ncbi:hypothetical protein FDN13_05875 [Caloramator sp. E03]|uniref:hypothetical protein n=1 Tax=Caloramator sp. E03 TaxID=2576307 RepID=UPI0011104B9D|nr:hypothetical protein [Caloramator sp. E03]QCX33268.1 hypothetical protein FDN13_05875 [Caloramator sp. E03]